MKRTTKYPGSKVALACASFLTLAGLTAAVAAEHGASVAAIAPTAVVVESNVTQDANGTGVERVPVRQREPVTQTRGS